MCSNQCTSTDFQKELIGLGAWGAGVGDSDGDSSGGGDGGGGADGGSSGGGDGGGGGDRMTLIHL